jgi:hypothetical protein
MPLSFKISFEKIDFKDEEFVTDIAKVEEFYNAGIVLELPPSGVSRDVVFGARQ